MKTEHTFNRLDPMYIEVAKFAIFSRQKYISESIEDIEKTKKSIEHWKSVLNELLEVNPTTAWFLEAQKDGRFTPAIYPKVK